MTCFAIFYLPKPSQTSNLQKEFQNCKAGHFEVFGGRKARDEPLCSFSLPNTFQTSGLSGPCQHGKAGHFEGFGCRRTQNDPLCNFSAHTTREAGHFEVFCAENLKTIRFATFQLPRPSQASEDPHNVMKSFVGFPKLLFPKWGKFIWGRIL